METSPPTPERNASSREASSAAIELRLRDVTQLFDVLDPSPVGEKDLDRRPEEYILESLRERPGDRPCEIVVHLDEATTRPDAESLVTQAIRGHFLRRADRLRRERRALLRRGLVSFAIALGFLVVTFFLFQAIRRLLGESGWPTVLREGLAILAWVAMWQPLEIFLYGWWPLLGDEKLCRRLGAIDVRLVSRKA